MSGIDFLVDTDCFIYFLEQHPILEPFIHDRWAFSFVTEIELLSKNGLSAKEEKCIRSMLASCFRVAHNQAITELTIAFRKKYKLKLPDAMIAATGQHLQIPIITADKQFGVVEEIDCILLDL